MIEYFVLAVVFLAFVLACVEDVRKREVYDYLNFGFILFVFLAAVFDSFWRGFLDPVLYVGFGLVLGFVFGFVFYYLGLWGGGDTKFLIGFGGSIYYLLQIGFFDFDFLQSSFLFEILTPYFLKFFGILSYFFAGLSFLFVCFISFRIFFGSRRVNLRNLIFSLIIFLVLGVGLVLRERLWVLVCGVLILGLVFFSEDDIFEFFSYGGFNFGFLVFFLSYLCLFVFLAFGGFGNERILFFMLWFLFWSFVAGGIFGILIVLYFGIRNWRKVCVKHSRRVLFLVGFFDLVVLVLVFVPLAVRLVFVLFSFLMYLFVVFAKEVERLVFVGKKSVDKLVLGDWVFEDIKVGSKFVFRKEDFRLGIDERQLRKLRDLAKKHKELGEVLVKDGIAFLPPLFVGFLLLIVL